MIQHGAVEDLQVGSRRVVERHDLLDSAVVGLGLRQLGIGDPGPVEHFFHLFQSSVVADLPAHRRDPISVAGHHDDPRRAFVHAQVKRGRIGPPLSFGESQYAEGELAPPIDVSVWIVT